MRRKGSSIIEAALLIPIMILLLTGMVELTRLAYTYFTLQKILYSLGRYLGASQAVDFCNSADETLTAAKNYALTGSTDASSEPILPDLTADMLDVRIERHDAGAQELGQCECSVTGCDAAAGGRPPDFVVVSIPNGYPVRLRIPLIPGDPIPLRPSLRLPYGGT